MPASTHEDRLQEDLRKIRFQIEEMDPVGNPDEFSDLAAAVLHYLAGLSEYAATCHLNRMQLRHVSGLTKIRLEEWVSGYASPIPRLRKRIVEAFRAEFLSTSASGG